MKRTTLDVSTAFLYTIVSMMCIITDRASMIVLFLNLCCTIRVAIKNAIQSSRTTNVIMEERGLNKKSSEKYHYFHIALVQITIIFIAVLIMVTLNWDMRAVIIRVFSILLILLVLFDDLESACVCIFDAYIDPFESKM